MAIKYVGTFTADLKDARGRRVGTLLWGDPVHVLEIYVIDVGQGDGVLLKTPEGNWHLIDAGMANKEQMTKKGTANFLRWKFQEDLRQQTVSLTNVIVTHPDYDHYGGLLDVLTGKLFDGRTFEVEVENFYHSGVGRFKAKPSFGRTSPGRVAPFPNGDHGIQRDGTFLIELFEGKDSLANPSRAPEASFAGYVQLAGQVPSNVRRLASSDEYLPGYAPGDTGVTIKVLGPILEELENGVVGFRVLDSDSVTRNGHSIVLRLDYGKARVLLTGDLNRKSQQLLLSYHAAAEFAVDVAKSCHHGSEDVSMDFIKAMKARATIISSGDNEDYSHPRPLLMGASARYGREAKGQKGELMPPLLYSTELARSVRLAFAGEVEVTLDGDPANAKKIVKPEATRIKPRQVRAGYRKLEYTPLSTDLIYGLVNVRTDGEHILCTTMEEKGNDFDVKVFKAGVDA